MLTKSSQPRAHQDEDKSSRRLLLMGGSANHWGGVEAFCDRAADALERNGRWAVDRIPTCTAHLNLSTFPAYLAGMRSLWRRRRALPDVAWIQYGNLLDLTYVLLAKMMGMRVMVTPHLGIGWRSQRNPLLRWLSYTILRTADRLALISPTQEAELMLPHSVPRTMIRTFLPKQIFDDAPADAAMLPPELQLIHAGRLSAGKGTFLLVDVCARLRDAGVPFAARIIGSADQATITRLRQAVVDRHNILIVGATSAGKTTLANALLAEVARHDERVVILQDVPELQCAAPDCVALRTRPGAVSMNDLVRSTLRLRPDRIVVGEVRGGEALDLLKAWNTGHPGGLSTIHANSARSALYRLEQLVQESVVAVPRRLIAEAVEVAKTADVVVMVLGDNEQTSREAWADNHLGDRNDLDLIGQQNDLAKAIFDLGKPTVVFLLNGRPLSVNLLAQRADAIIEGWYLGQETGNAAADILFGRANPGGKLPVSIARDVGQLPIFYNRKPTARRGYLFDAPTSALYPFGFGLSYTRFDISAPRLAKASIGQGESVAVEVDVANTGKVAGDEVVQLYVHDVAASVTRPVLELKHFKRVTLAAGAKTTVTFQIAPSDLWLWNLDMKRVVEPGDFEILVGPNSVDLKKATLTVV